MPYLKLKLILLQVILNNETGNIPCISNNYVGQLQQRNLIGLQLKNPQISAGFYGIILIPGVMF
jgi:hypothetical protein